MKLEVDKIESYDMKYIMDMLYALLGKKVISISLIEGTYKTVFKAILGDNRKIALILLHKDKTLSEFESEMKILSCLSHITHTQLPILEYKVPYLVYNRQAYITSWIEHDIYDGSLKQAFHAIDAFIDITNKLCFIKRPDYIKETAISSGKFLDWKFNFGQFKGLVKGFDWETVFLENLEFLNQISTVLQQEYMHIKDNICHVQRSITHHDPVPSNFGFDGTGLVKAIFDFDLFKLSLPIYDYAWMWWSFATYNKSLDEEETILMTRQIMDHFYINKININYFPLLVSIRLILTLHGRLVDKFIYGKDSLRFIKYKILSLKYINSHCQ